MQRIVTYATGYS